MKKENKTGLVTKPSSSVFSLSCMLSPLKRTRLGELLVTKGVITPHQLKHALALQKVLQKPLGEIFVETSVISRPQLSMILARQFVLRSAATLILGAMSLGSMAGKKAWADMIQDVPAKISVSFNTSAAYGSMQAYPAFFGTEEKRSENLKPFTKWSAMFSKFDQELKSGRNNTLVQEWRATLKQYEGMDIKTMAIKVNDFMNAKPYKTDSKNYGNSDYWATPIEFLQNGGDCEDFAIAKYTALRALGVPEERLRVAIVHDNLKNIPHAVLVVYTEQGAYVLDNQIKTLVSTAGAGRYRPIYSINRTAWWLHTAPETTLVASAR